MVMRLSSAVHHNEGALRQFYGEFASLSFLWQDDIYTQYKSFLSQSPNMEVKPGNQQDR